MIPSSENGLVLVRLSLISAITLLAQRTDIALSLLGKIKTGHNFMPTYCSFYPKLHLLISLDVSDSPR